ncbi:MAG: bifunctional adenosylcobinamide kinase/adenosylcobinamide-phosphate guanylyltransferase [Dehalococcoidia bacterium]|nr:MAG: bifunctional adenosylcobinamide kinase/adenosylcobinamide-phosphate guanylyltransferase [Dehalococcoidia bacterium]
MGQIWFVTGGARSGKSSYAERLAASLGTLVTYIATLEPLDGEMRARIARHQVQRPAAWRTIEAPRTPLAAARSAEAGDTILLDCLSLWVSNRLLDLRDEAPSPADVDALEISLVSENRALLECLALREGTSVIVSNEVGSGLVPEYALGRAYRDLLGRINQQVSETAERAWLLVAGRALELPPVEDR